MANCDAFRSFEVRVMMMLKRCLTSTETVGLLGTGAQDVHLDFHTAPELCDDDDDDVGLNVLGYGSDISGTSQGYPWTYVYI